MRDRARGSRENGHGKSGDKIMTRGDCDAHDPLQGHLQRRLLPPVFCGRIISENKHKL
jgi:hypothetical protein